MTNVKTKSAFVRTGDFFFKWRNYVFPVIVLSLLILFRPAAEYGGSKEMVAYKDVIALFLVIAGLSFRAATIGWAYIKRGGLNKEVYADTLVTSGFFGLCRNPLYVGNVAIYAGLFILHGHPFVIVAGIGLYCFIYQSIIAAEEYFLLNKFGVEFEAYCARVPRWLPKLSLYKKVTQGMAFSITRAVAKDYTTFSNTVLGVIIIALMKSYHADSQDDFIRYLQIGAVLVILLAGCVFMIKKMKKAGRLANT